MMAWRNLSIASKCDFRAVLVPHGRCTQGYQGILRPLWKNAMLKALALLLFSIFLIHFYIAFQTGHLDPCEAAYTKLKYSHINFYSCAPLLFRIGSII